MNIKIKASQIYCLIGDDYGRVYSALKRQLGDGEEQIFTERTPGDGYLQWELPGDGWQCLADEDPIMGATVRETLRKRMELVGSKFGANTAMAQRVLSVPGDEYVYFKASANGGLDIKLTAWGYKYPERIGGNEATGDAREKTDKQTTCIKLVNNGHCKADYPFKLNGFNRRTDSEGKLLIGDLPVGYKFNIEVDGITHPASVTAGNSEIVIDLTRFCDLIVHAVLNGAPYAGAEAEVAYDNTTKTLVLDASGNAVLHTGINDGEICAVTIDGETRRVVLHEPTTEVNFELTKQAEVIIPEPPEEKKEEKPEEKPEERKVPEEPEGDPHEDTGGSREVQEEKPEEKDKPEKEEKPEKDDPQWEITPMTFKDYILIGLASLGVVLLTLLTYGIGRYLLQ